MKPSRLRSASAAAPSLLGAAVLAVAATGAVSAGPDSGSPEATSAVSYVPQASVLTGASAVISNSALEEREQAVSRDWRREALATAAEEELQEQVEAQAEERNAALAKLAADAEKYAAELVANGWVLPIDPGSYRLTATFGQSSGLWATTHTGLDFAAPSGTPVRSVARGVVTETGYAGAYGNRVIVTHEDGTEVWYCHLSSIGASTGDRVDPGELVGTVGSTGNSTGPHLHLEIRPGAGDPVDPLAALRVRGVTP